jgi:hypothetical protein
MGNTDAEDDRAETLAALQHAAIRIAKRNSTFKRAIGSLIADLEVIIAAIGRDPEIWRLNRAFHVVHAPSLSAVLAVFDDADPNFDSVDKMATVDDAEMHQIYASLHQAVQLATQARDRIERAKVTDAKVELNVLADAAPTPKVPFAPATLFTRTWDGVAATSQDAWAGAKSGLTSLPGFVGRIKGGAEGAVARVGAVPVLAANLQKSVAGVLRMASQRQSRCGCRPAPRPCSTGWGPVLGWAL